MLHARDQLAADLLGQLDQDVALRVGVDQLPGDGALRGRQRLEQVRHLGGVQRVHHAVRAAQAPGREGFLDRGEARAAVVERGRGLGHCGSALWRTRSCGYFGRKWAASRSTR